MSFQCPGCKDLQSLEIEASLQLFRGRCDNEITIQTVVCQRCRFSGVAVYEEGRRGSVDTRAWKHMGCFMDDTDLSQLKALILDCPDRSNPNCACPAHLKLGICDGHGDWVGLDQFNPRDCFPMRLKI